MNIEFHPLPGDRWKARLTGCSVSIECGEGGTKEAAYQALYRNWRAWITPLEASVNQAFRYAIEELNREKEQS